MRNDAAVDPGSLADELASELVTRSHSDAWAACASLWARVFVLAAPAWTRWPDLHATVAGALAAALDQVVGADPEVGCHLERLGAFDIEDDGSAEWQHAIDLVAMLLPALEGDDAGACVRTAVLTHLEGTFNTAANRMAITDGHPLSHTEATARITSDDQWRQAVTFVKGL